DGHRRRRRAAVQRRDAADRSGRRLDQADDLARHGDRHVRAWRGGKAGLERGEEDARPVSSRRELRAMPALAAVALLAVALDAAAEPPVPADPSIRYKLLPPYADPGF